MGRKGGAASPSPEHLDILLAALKSAKSTTEVAGAVQAISDIVSSLSLQTRTSVHSQQAKQLATFYIEVIKQVFVRLSANQQVELLSACLQLARLALNGLHAARHVLKGRSYEVEVQHYALVRRLVSLKAFPEALEQGWVLFARLCQLWPAAHNSSKQRANDRVLKRGKACEQEWQQPASDLALQLGGPTGEVDNSEQAANIVVGTVLNLALSTVEGCQSDVLAEQLAKLLSPIEQLGPWLK